MNLHCLNDDWKFRFTHIINKIVELSPDIVSLQEVCINPKTGDNAIDYLKSELSRKGYPVAADLSLYTHKAWDQFDEYILIISKKTISAYDSQLFPPSLLQRGYVALKFNDIWFINTHLEYRSDNSNFRNQEIEILRQHFNNTPHVIMGDFNSAPDSIEQSQLGKNGYMSLFPNKSFQGNDGNFADNIDGFWISPVLRSYTTRASTSVHLNYLVDGKALSDHFAVQAQLWLK
jgi:endonuclease/exonuclease/phosphatase family metal-dependent hydrolase